MPNEINVKLFKEHKVIFVDVYSKTIQLAKKKIYELVEDDSVVMLKESDDSLNVTVIRDMRFVIFRARSFLKNNRGIRSHYAYVDKYINEFNTINEIVYSTMSMENCSYLEDGKQIENPIIMY